MKFLRIILIIFIVLPVNMLAQDLKNLEIIAPYHEDLAAVKKGGKWAFINSNGEIAINFRDDLSDNILLKKERKHTNYPFFSDGMCITKNNVNNISYYGYINKNGETKISPQFINATPFEHGHAVILKVSKEYIGKNNLLAKNVVSYSYDELLINKDGEVVMFLNGPKHLILSSEKLQKPPAINSFIINEKLIAIKDDKGNWEIKTF